MEIYRLSNLGYALAHSRTNPDTPEWRVIHYLAKMHSASGEKIISDVQGVNIFTLGRLRKKQILLDETGVNV